jgi:2-phospho-L-lactate guanylyltransferase
MTVGDGTESTRRIWAVVPFRGPVGSKRRLAGLLDPSEREQLSLAMLHGVLDVLLGGAGIERVLLLTPTRTAVDWPTHARLTIVEEPRIEGGPTDGDGLNAALRYAQRVATAGLADGLLILPSDLPRFARADLDAVLAASVDAPVVIAPDRAAEGTNALLLRPPLALAPSFGLGSFTRHRQRAEQAGHRVVVVERAGLGLDLDTPADVAALLADPQNGLAVSLLRTLGVERRLSDLEPAQARSTTI